MKNVFPAAAICSVLAGALFACNQQPDSQAASTATPAPFSTEGKTVLVYTTADGTALRLSPTDTLTFKDLAQPLETDVCVVVDPNRSFQTVLGIGGALTDASAETFAKLPKDRQQELLNAYYDPQKGIGYSLGRTSIHSCDFSSASYTYVSDNDSVLKTFSVDHDRQFRIPFIKQVIAAAGGKLTLFSSPWSPPAWMKTNKEMSHGGKLKPEDLPGVGGLLCKVYQGICQRRHTDLGHYDPE